jgi:hypothetical protein
MKRSTPAQYAMFILVLLLKRNSGKLWLISWFICISLFFKLVNSLFFKMLHFKCISVDHRAYTQHLFTVAADLLIFYLYLAEKCSKHFFVKDIYLYVFELKNLEVIT